MIPHASNPDKVWKLEIMYISNDSINNQKTKIIDFDYNFAPTLLDNLTDKGYTKHSFRKSLEQFIEEQEALKPSDIVISGRMVLVNKFSVREMFQNDYHKYQESIEESFVDESVDEESVDNKDDYSNYVDNSYSYGINNSYGYKPLEPVRTPPNRPPPTKKSSNMQGSNMQGSNESYFTSSYGYIPLTQNDDGCQFSNQDFLNNLISDVNPNSNIDDYEFAGLPKASPSPFIDGFVYSSY